MVTRPYKKRAVSCECGACLKCKGRAKNARLRAANPEYLRHGREAAKAQYQLLSEDERKTLTLKRSSYQKKYRADNLDRKKELGAKLYLANRDEIRKKAKATYLANPEPYKSRAKALYRANPKIVAERAARWNKENVERRAEICRRSSQANPETGRMACANRRARIKGAGGKITGNQVKNLFAKQKGVCAGCRAKLGDDFELDHVTPLVLGGAHAIENAQLLCQTCNRRKGKKHPQVWAAELGRLFA